MSSARLSKHQLIQTGISLLYQDFGQDACSLTYAIQPRLWFTGCLHPSVCPMTIWYVTDENTIKVLQAASWKDRSLQTLCSRLLKLKPLFPSGFGKGVGGQVGMGMELTMLQTK